MSIWISIGVGPAGHALDAVPERDTYTGETDTNSTTTYMVDVATTWHDCVRLSLDEWEDNNGRIVRAVQTLLNPAEVELLIHHLQEAADDIKRNP